MGATGHVVDKERLVGRGCVQIAYVLDGVVRYIGGEVVIGLTDPWKDLGRIPKEVGCPLVGLASHEPIEILEAHADRPLVERPCDAVLKAWRIVILAKPRGGVTVVSQDRADSGVVRPYDGIIARITGGQLADHAKSHRVMIAPCDESGARGRAQGRRVELRVAQSRLGDTIQRRRGYDAAERARNAVALVVSHDEQDVGRALGRYDSRRPLWRGILGAFFDNSAERQRRRRELFPIKRYGRAGRTRHAVDLLSRRARCREDNHINYHRKAVDWSYR